tara:strand:+ start:1301 stop:2254 length:954 start_codon:yes stop_codon:yes gene_type:complete
MATTTSITTTYAGEFAGQYISKALLSGVTLAQGGITVKPNIKFKEVIKKVDTNAVVKDASCDFDPTSTVTLTERILQPEYQQVNLQLCKADFQTDWEAISMGFSAHQTLPKSFSDFLIAHVAAKVAERTEQSIWAGNTSTNGQFDGLTTQLAVDAGLPAAQEVASTTVTAANVITELGKIVDAIPSTIYGNEDMNIYVSSNIARAYVRALGGFATDIGANGTDNKGTQWYSMGQGLAFDGVKIFATKGLADNTAIAAEKSNLYFGTGLLADHNEVKVIDMADIDGSQNVRVVMRFTAGVQYGIVDDVVTYGVTNSAN